MALPLMRKATAVWLVENTSLTFMQIANFCGLHELEVSGIADGEVASGIRGMDPITSNQLTLEEIKRCELDPNSKLELIINPATILNSFEKKRSTFPIAEAAAPSTIKTNEKPNEKRIVLVKTVDLSLSISPKSFPVIYEI